MHYHPETMLQLAYETRHGMIEEAERFRLLTATRRHRRWARHRAGAPAASEPAGTLAACAPAALPAR